MKKIQVFRHGKLVTDMPWTEYDEKYFKNNEPLMIGKDMSYVIVDDDSTILNNSFVGYVHFFGKVKQDRNGETVRWSKVTVKVSNIPSLTVGTETWIKIPVKNIRKWFPVGVPNKYVFVLPVITGNNKWIHNIKTVSCCTDEPTTTIEV